jgi:hypothetical protein
MYQLVACDQQVGGRVDAQLYPSPSDAENFDEYATVNPEPLL